MPKLSNTLIVLPYDPNWATEFECIRDYLMEQIGDLVIEIKHTGSTSVPGLAAKPIIDIIAVMESYAIFPTIVSRLKKVGFQHEGDGGMCCRMFHHSREAWVVCRNMAVGFG